MVQGGIDWEVESLEKKEEEMRWKVNKRWVVGTRLSTE